MYVWANAQSVAKRGISYGDAKFAFLSLNGQFTNSGWNHLRLVLDGNVAYVRQANTLANSRLSTEWIANNTQYTYIHIHLYHLLDISVGALSFAYQALLVQGRRILAFVYTQVTLLSKPIGEGPNTENNKAYLGSWYVWS